MKSGRISLVAILVILGLVFLGGVIVFSSGSDTPETAIVKFMDALARGDAKALAATSHIDGETEAEVQKKWENTLSYTKYYQFQWTFKGAKEQDSSFAVAKVNMLGAGGSVDADFNIPLVKQEEKWKVDVSTVDRGFYPSLPK